MSNKIAILTFHWSDNYGAVLQTYALKKHLESLENEVCIINYKPIFKMNKGSALARIKHFLWKTVFKNLCFGFVRVIKTKKFRKKFLNIDCRAKEIDFNNLEQITENFDYIIVGSDQVWNFDITNDFETFTLSFTEKCKKISYAASFGKYDLASTNILAFDNIKKFSAVSVRDVFSKDILDKNNIDSEVVVDPTLLLNKSDWQSLFNLEEKKENYILCYVMPSKNKKVIRKLHDISNKLAKKYNTKVVYIGKKEFEVFKFYQKNNVFAGPNDFLQLFYNAKCVVTNSFHGTMFSLNFGKEFFVPIDSNVENEKRISLRIENFLEQLGMEDRIIDVNEEFVDSKVQPIDFDSVSKKLENQINLSKEFINKNILNNLE